MFYTLGCFLHQASLIWLHFQELSTFCALHIPFSFLPSNCFDSIATIYLFKRNSHLVYQIIRLVALISVANVPT